MTPDQGDVLISQVIDLTNQVDELTQRLVHLSGQIDTLHQTMATLTQYGVWTFGIIAVICMFVALVAGYLIAKGR